MNFFNAMWMKLTSLFKEANIKPLTSVPTPTPAGEEVREDEVVVKEETPKTKDTPPRKQLTKNFHIDEFACHDGTAVPEELYDNVLELAENLQLLRDKIGKPIKINSGYRHAAYNTKIGGAKNSYHTRAMAADIRVKGIGPERLSDIVHECIKTGLIKKGGLGRYVTFTHYDIRGKSATWRGSKKRS